MKNDDFECVLREIAFRLECVSAVCRQVARLHRGTHKQGVNYLKSLIQTDDVAYIQTLIEVINDK